MMNYAVVVHKLSENDGGGYLALVPDLYGCMSDGETPEEAIANVQAAITDWLEVAKQLGRSVPAPGSSVKRARAREAALVETIKIFSEQFDGLDGRIDRLFNEIEHIKELIENQESWDRFDRLVLADRELRIMPQLAC